MLQHEAIARMLEGEKVRSRQWDSDSWLSIKNGRFIGSTTYGKNSQITATVPELQEDVWEIYEDELDQLKVLRSMIRNVYSEPAILSFQKLKAFHWLNERISHLSNQ